MIHVKHRNFHSDIDGFDEDYIITVDGESISQFKELVNRALNCWDDAPKDLKELGDMLSHGKILQQYSDSPSQSKIKFLDPAPIENLDLPKCELCGQLGEGHMYNCPTQLKE